MPRPPASLALLALLALSACLLDRLYEVRQRLCRFDENVVVDGADGLRVGFLHPVLLEDDVRWLVGAEPTAIELEEDRHVLRYAIERDRPVADPVPLHFVFRRQDDEWRLAEIGAAGHLADTVSVSLVDQGLRAVCAAREDLGRAEVVFDLRGLDRALLPTAASWAASLGPADPDGRYQLRLAGSARTGWISPTFDADGRLQGLVAGYLRYRVEADFTSGRAALGIAR